MSVFWLTALVVLLIDQLSKYFMLMSGREEIVFNQGISWGMTFLRGGEKIIDIILLIAIFWWWKNHSSQDKFTQISWGLFLGAGLSNTLDRFFYGGVVDWWRWEALGFTNNVADLVIFVAVIGIIIGSLRNAK